MVQAEKAAAWFWLPDSSSISTEAVASWVVGVIRKITADRVTMLRTKTNTPMLTIDGQMIGKVTVHTERRSPAPSTVAASSRIRRLSAKPNRRR